MRSLELISSKPPANEELVRSFEHLSGLTIPREYRAWLMIHDGALPSGDNDLIPEETVPGLPGGIYVAEFFGISTIRNKFQIYGGRIQPGLIPISHDQTGNLICLSTTGEDTGAVFYWDHEREPAAYELIGEEPPSESNLVHIAPSFETFLDLLEPSP